ncbi:FadR/GntR family transcriptional regulator [Microbulbifer sp. HZ11]|uniref:FadR/GntR family transcriptional regulator n=1 Tax=Microbulbifer sp. HZ11 TaxID=1453501 RepID=UPI0005B9A5D7|nr:FadR/GntR family transcriptional regulator [Microbulbifer sp. HZ11]
MSELLYYDLKRSVSMSPSLSVQVARELGRRIVAGAIDPDTLLDEENTLAERFKVSRVVIRDAVKILVSKGMLDVRRGIGTRVRPRNDWNLLDDDVLAWHLSAPPSREFLMQLLEIRLAFEPKAARWAAERGSKEDIEAIKEACDRMEAAVASSENFVVADALFHKAILHAANNEILTAIEGVIYSALLVSIKITNQTQESNLKSIPFHRSLYQAIAAGKAEKAEKMAGDLLGDAAERLRKEIEAGKE